jgi:hypothetical protein
VPMVAVAWATFAQLRAMSAVDDAEPEAPDPREADPPPPETPVNPPTVL